MRLQGRTNSSCTCSNHAYNNKFKSDSQRLVLSLQARLVFTAQCFRSGVSVVHPLIWRYDAYGYSANTNRK
ncbi:hypothetical protein DA100_10295 [Vibrio sp. Hep-1b-8]|nr:hypothetical protein DA100_10295 [Vibrio sp. Hep-1b-8]